MAERLEQLRELAVQSTHDGERINALRAAAREQGSSYGFERMICGMERRARTYERLAKDYPAVPGLHQLATDEREAMARSFEACSNG